MSSHLPARVNTRNSAHSPEPDASVWSRPRSPLLYSIASDALPAGTCGQLNVVAGVLALNLADCDPLVRMIVGTSLVATPFTATVKCGSSPPPNIALLMRAA